MATRSPRLRSRGRSRTQKGSRSPIRRSLGRSGSRSLSRSLSRSGSRSRAPSPTDPALYQRVKAQIYRRHPMHSAYRSGMVVKSYKQAFSKRHGPSRSPYRGGRGSRGSRSGSLSRWFQEKWVNQRGEVGYKYKSDIYRPSVRVNRHTPKTYRELSPSALKRARQEKARTGRVARF